MGKNFSMNPDSALVYRDQNDVKHVVAETTKDLVKVFGNASEFQEKIDEVNSAFANDQLESMDLSNWGRARPLAKFAENCKKYVKENKPRPESSEIPKYGKRASDTTVMKALQRLAQEYDGSDPSSAEGSSSPVVNVSPDRMDAESDDEDGETVVVPDGKTGYQLFMDTLPPNVASERGLEMFENQINELLPGDTRWSDNLYDDLIEYLGRSGEYDEETQQVLEEILGFIWPTFKGFGQQGSLTFDAAMAKYYAAWKRDQE